MKQLIFCTYLLLVGNICIAQPQAAIDYVSLYKTCDSLNGLKKMAALDKGLTQQLNQIDKKTPYHFFAEALYFIEQNQFPEAAIFFHVGLVRQNYYIGVNNNYAPNEDWQYAESMKSISAKKLIPFLQSNADNYLQVLKVAIEYCEKNDYDFSSKLNYPDKYQNAINKLKDLQADILKNKEQFKKDWEAERARLLAKKV
jgi:hypothetical protein